MKQKDAIKLSAAIALIAAAGIILYITMREPAAPAPAVPAPTGDTAAAPAPGAAPKNENLQFEGKNSTQELPRGPIRVAPQGK